MLQLQQQRPADRSGGGGGGGGGELAALCSLGWSLAAAGCLHHPAVAAVAAELAGAAERMPPGGVRKPLLLQLHQFGTALRYEAEQQEAAAEQVQGGQGQGAEQGAAAAWDMLQQRAACRQLLQAAAAAWQAETQQRATKLVSACQSDVAATARGGLGLAVREECAVSGFSGKQRGWPPGPCCACVSGDSCGAVARVLVEAVAADARHTSPVCVICARLVPTSTHRVAHAPTPARPHQHSHIHFPLPQWTLRCRRGGWRSRWTA